MCVAYFIMIHKNPGQFERLFKTIYHPENYYLVHVDSKSRPEIHSRVASIIESYSNAYLLERENVVWAGYSLVGMQLRGINRLLDISSRWDFFINLSGQDFPLVTQDFILDFLSHNEGRNFIKVSDQRKNRYSSYFRVRTVFWEVKEPLNKVIPLPIVRRYPQAITAYVGSGWFILSRDFCEFAVRDKLSSNLQTYYRHTFCPDEGFFQTLIMNSGFKNTIINDNKRVIHFPPGSWNPVVLTSRDFDMLVQSRGFFARKFDEKVDSQILKMLEDHLRC